MPRQLAFRAGQATGRAAARGKIFEADRRAALSIAIEDMRSENRLAEMAQRMKVSNQQFEQRQQEEETRRTRNALSTEMGIQAAASGKSLSDMAGLDSDPRAVVAYSQTRREMNKTAQKNAMKEEGALYRSFAGGMRAEIANRVVDVNDPAEVRVAVKDIFDERRAKAMELSEAKLAKEADEEWKWIYKEIVTTGFSDPVELLGSDEDLAGALRADGSVDWLKLRKLVKQKWSKAKKVSKEQNTFTPEPADDANAQFDELSAMLGGGN